MSEAGSEHAAPTPVSTRTDVESAEGKSTNSTKWKLRSPVLGALIFLIILVLGLLVAVILMATLGPTPPQTKPRPEALRMNRSTAVPADASTSGTTRKVAETTTTTEKRSTETTRTERKSTEAPRRNVCESPECLTLAHQLHNWGDKTADPCDNFYKYTCGRFSEHTDSTGYSQEKSNIVRDLVRKFIVRRRYANSTSRSEILMGLLYEKCEEHRNNDSHREQVKTSAIELLENIRKIGKWPMIEPNWTDSMFDLNDMLSNMAEFHMRELGLFQFIPSDSKHLEISSDESLMAETLDNNDTFLLINLILRMNEVKFNKSVVHADILDARKFHDKFAATLENDASDSVRKDFSELKALNLSVDFERIAQKLVHPKRGNWTELRNRLRFHNESIFTSDSNNLNHVINQTSPRVLANFLILRLIDKSVSSMRIVKNDESEADCAKRAMHLLPRAALRIFVQNHFKRGNREKVRKVVDSIRSAYSRMFNASTWLDETTKETAVRKLDNMETVVGYPDEFEANGTLDRLFETIDFNANDTFYGLVQKVERFRTEQAMDFLTSDDQFLPPDMNLLSANALYNDGGNFFAIFVPYMDEPYFDPSYPEYVSFASPGGAIAHELGHAFDEQGRLFDENEVMRDWWTKESTARYNRTAQCLVEQYNEYDDPDYGRKLKGKKKLNEMIADHLSMEATWRAFKTQRDFSGEASLVGFEAVPLDQMFFRLMALQECKAPNRKPLKIEHRVDHPTASFRVNGVVSNTKSFAETFRCPLGSPMNPDKKCSFFGT
ncbi:unnamed protein product [Caenorhabditis sp. 36 PRJEB53466]|nr:unnamed protein product [Caenorhabditis sp. 36 PRJEB53466]